MIEYKPTVTLGSIIGIITILGSILGTYVTMSNKNVEQDGRMAGLDWQISRAEHDRIERNAEVDKKIDEVNRKLDALDSKMTRLLINDHNSRFSSR